MDKIWELSNKTIRVRLTAWYVFLLALTLIVFSSYLYIKQEKSLLAQLDTALQVTASQTLNDVIESNGHPVFRRTQQFKELNNRLLASGFAVRLIGDDGKIWDGLGNFQALPDNPPKVGGYVNVVGHETTWRIYNQSLQDFTGWLQTAESLDPLNKASTNLLTLILLSFPLVLMVAALGGLFLADQALQPIDRIIRTAQAISAKDFTQRIAHTGPYDEVGRLATTIDRMLDRLQAAFDREHQFTADASHELRTPLTVIKGQLEVSLSRPRTASDYENTLKNVLSEADRLIRLTNGLLFLSRLEQSRVCLSLQTVDLSNLLFTLVEQMQPLADAKEIHLDHQILPDLFIQGNPDYLINLVINLLDNAIKYTPNGSNVTLEALQDPQQVLVMVKDTGPGIDSQHLPHLFERFYRVEEARSRSTGGVGLGLAIAYEIARFHHGNLKVESEINRGTTFILTLPLV